MAMPKKAFLFPIRRWNRIYLTRNRHLGGKPDRRLGCSLAVLSALFFISGNSGYFRNVPRAFPLEFPRAGTYPEHWPPRRPHEFVCPDHPYLPPHPPQRTPLSAARRPPPRLLPPSPRRPGAPPQHGPRPSPHLHPPPPRPRDLSRPCLEQDGDQPRSRYRAHRS